MVKQASSSWTESATTALRVGKGFQLSTVDPNSTPGYAGDKETGSIDLDTGIERLSALQEMLFACSRTQDNPERVLLVLQAMDSAGKGGIVRHVVGGVDPQGVELASFKKPTPEELEHDFLWRIEKRLPDAGMIGVFDRSHYEDVLVGRVRSLASPEEIERRYDAINAFEAELITGGTRIIKVMLHISYDEQKTRLMERLERADKHWKYNPGDVDERQLWPDYMQAYQAVFDRTSTEAAPWYVIPADRKWYARLAVQELLLAALLDINPQWPPADFDVATEMRRLAAT